MSTNATPPDDLSDMPVDPRWRRDAAGWLLHLRFPGDCGVGVAPGPKQERTRQELDWWHLYYTAADAVRELRRRLR